MGWLLLSVWCLPACSLLPVLHAINAAEPDVHSALPLACTACRPFAPFKEMGSWQGCVVCWSGEWVVVSARLGCCSRGGMQPGLRCQALRHHAICQHFPPPDACFSRLLCCRR